MMVIAIDTGNRYIKTAHAVPFSAGLNSHGGTPPIIATDTLCYGGNYYTFSETQGFHRQDKTQDDYYFILSLAAIAREIVMKTAMLTTGKAESELDFASVMKSADRGHMSFCEDVFLSVGLPPRDIKALGTKLKKYYMRDGSRLRFKYNSISFDIGITDVFVSPQGFAAVFPKDLFSRVTKAPQAYIIDIGGYTTDVALIANKKIDTNYFESLDFGVIHMYNEVASYIARECQKNINGVLIEAVLRGENIGDGQVEMLVRGAANVYAAKIIDALRDRRIDMSLSLPVLVGGGSVLLQEPLREAIGRDEIFFVPDVRANAIGYETLANRILKERNNS